MNGGGSHRERDSVQKIPARDPRAHPQCPIPFFIHSDDTNSSDTKPSGQAAHVPAVETGPSTSRQTRRAPSLGAEERSPMQTRHYPTLIAESGAWKATL